MRRSELVVAVVVITTVVSSAAVAVTFGVRRIQPILGGLDAQTGMALGVIAVALSLIAAIRAAGRRQSNLWWQSERARVYQALLDAMADRAGDATPAQAAFARTVFLVGSVSVVKEYRTLFQTLAAGNASEESVKKHVNRLILAMRRDVGQPMQRLENEDWADWLLGKTTELPAQGQKASAETPPPRFAAAPAHRL